MTSFDIHKPAARDIVERHIGPLFLGLAADPAWRDAPTLPRPVPNGDGARTAIVVPVHNQSRASLLAFVAQFGMNRLDDDQALHLVLCRPDPGLEAELARQAAFYDVALNVLVPARPIDAAEALELGVAATRSDEILFLAPTVYPTEAGWIARLRALLLADPRTAAVCPTLLYEDDSIEFAGIERVEPRMSAPFVAPVRRFGGYPAARLRGEAARPSFVGTLDCCLMRREALTVAGGLVSPLSLPALRAVDLFMRLNTRGLRTLWNPDVTVYHLGGEDGPATETPYWMQTGELIDGWTFRHTWNHEMHTERG